MFCYLIGTHLVCFLYCVLSKSITFLVVASAFPHAGNFNPTLPAANPVPVSKVTSACNKFGVSDPLEGRVVPIVFSSILEAFCYVAILSIFLVFIRFV